MFEEVTPGPRWSPDSHYAKEMRKWNKPYVFEMFPKMLFKAAKRATGGPWIVVDPLDERFSAANQITVQNENEMERAIRDGWCMTPQEAVARQLGFEKDISDAAAHRAYEDRNMSASAKAEIAAAEEATSDHVAEVVQKPIKRRVGRPKKETPA